MIEIKTKLPVLMFPARLICLGIMCFVGLNQISSQDLVFSQFYNTPLQLNPAFAGNTTSSKFAAIYRNQWPSLNTSYNSYAVSWDRYFKKMNSGFGLWISNDEQGDGVLSTLEVKGIYGYKIKFNYDWQLKIGIEAGFKQFRLDWDKLLFYDQIDRIEGPSPGGVPIPSSEVRPDNLSRRVFDMSTGFLLYNPDFYIGLTLKHLTSPYMGLSDTDFSDREGLPYLISLHGGYQLILIEGNNRQRPSFLSPNVFFAKQGDFHQLNIGSYLQIQSVFGGMWMRHTFGNIDALIFSFGVDTDMFKIGYSFDLTISDLGLSTGGSHELGIIMNIPTLSNSESKINDCLMLFR